MATTSKRAKIGAGIYKAIIAELIETQDITVAEKMAAFREANRAAGLPADYRAAEMSGIFINKAFN